jgi:hypothetical protein
MWRRGQETGAEQAARYNGRRYSEQEQEHEHEQEKESRGVRYEGALRTP